jgi:anti-anti-sigma factor
MSEGGTMTISREHRDRVEVIHLEGEVDLTNAELVREAVEAATSEAVVLDLTDVVFLDSIAVTTLDGAQERLIGAERSLYVVSPPGSSSDWTLRASAGIHGDVVRESLDEALVAAVARHVCA